MKKIWIKLKGIIRYEVEEFLEAMGFLTKALVYTFIFVIGISFIAKLIFPTLK